ncbi:ead/Ea22-like family protein [Klebsiella pneumoniae]|uniref:ead/Ea22-like family protein n=1 Tax=Klebsiella pneumoniae TaxID=573 RepID=UPI000F503C96|nr:ead/Ea22-like family protein [Klebsiella pneumoniae]AYY23400.1 ead/Ea22-like family protein [Klebsiella pneumoniae]MCQ0515139.1 ead/Ea22-like family protein [Klebsiella pneumoniae]HBQ6744757.1 ead/Ea22-like family protein [Klebsiella pneumoniae]HCA3660708.1 ead/Ea22-like family protein [Klebsiella pneumoniae]HDE1914665.1 ead/Ea22-like family protein [Klebsiella pneumoniae]
MTDITELAQRMKAAAEKATPGPWYVHDKPCEDGNYGIDTSDKEFLAEAVVWWGFARQSIWREEDAKYIALANPANILALVEALEKAQQERENWRTSFDNERFRADKLKAYIDDMEPIRAAAEKLVRCKGRYHSEQNYRALAALFGVKTPDLPPLENENVHYADAAEMEIAALRQRIAELESHTVKLPKPISVLHRREFTAAHCAIYAYPEAEVNAALAAAGIKWEVE